MKKTLAVSLVLLVILNAHAPLVYAKSNTQFFTMSDRWNNRFRAGEAPSSLKPQSGRSVGPVISDEGSKFFEDDTEIYVPGSPYITPETEYISKSELAAAPTEIIELKLNQIMEIRGRFRRYLTSHEDIIQFIPVRTDLLQIKALDLGTAYIHLWDENGRSTYQVRVTRPPYRRSIEEKRYIDALQHGESLKLEYSNQHTQIYAGNDFNDLGQTDLTYTQDMRVRGDTPYGHFEGGVALRNSDTKSTSGSLAGIDGHLTDAKIGPFQNFDLHMGDTRVDQKFIMLPSTRVRGVVMDYRHPNQTQDLEIYYGRQLFNPLTSTEDAFESKDDFLGGFKYDWQWADWANITMGYSQGYGQEREELTADKAGEIIQRYNIGKHFEFVSDVAYDDTHFSHTEALEMEYDKFDGSVTYRDINKEFLTLLGVPSAQGEQGVRVLFNANPTQKLSMHYDADVYRNRIFPAPGESDRFNLDQRGDMTYDFGGNRRLRLDFASYEDTAEVSPSRSFEWGANYTDVVRVWEHDLNVYGALRDRNFESLSSPDTNYRSDKLIAGVSLEIPWDMYVSVEKEITLLEETTLRSNSHPHVTTFAITRNAQIGDTPFHSDFTIRYRNEEETESARSFLAGEDRLELSGSLRYRLTDMEFFLNGRFTSITEENSTLEPVRAEAEVTAGMRYLFDTGVHWEPTGQFDGYVFNDLNNDGIMQANEDGLPNMVIDIGGERFSTDATGYFKSTGISGQKADVILTSQNIPTGFAPSTAFSQVRRVKQGTVARVDFGLTARSYIYGFVFNDVNDNGELDREDKGIFQARVLLDQETPMITDIRGRFEIADTPIGFHRIDLDVQSLPIGYLPSKKTRRDIDLSEGVGYRIIFPLITERKVSGRVFVDTNDDGKVNPGERTLSDIVVTLGSLQATTDSEGYYLFDEVPAGSLRLYVEGTSLRGYQSTFEKKIYFTQDPQTLIYDIPVSSSN